MKYSFALVCLLAFSLVSYAQEPVIKIRQTGTPAVHPPLLVLDGKEMPELVKSTTDSTKLVSPLNNIDPNNIERVDVLKDEHATNAYGEKGKYGVIMIYTKTKK